MMRDLRCDGFRRTGVTAGQRCGLLLLRYDDATSGLLEIRCPRCYTTRLWPLRVLVGAST